LIKILPHFVKTHNTPVSHRRPMPSEHPWHLRHDLCQLCEVVGRFGSEISRECWLWPYH